jgi:3D (Asp-Asp-Asp) domain-containing protein
MRVIRIVAILLMLLAVILPQIASADETNTDTNTKTYFARIASLFSSEAALADEKTNEVVIEPAAQEEKVKTEEEIKNEAILAKWKVKQTKSWENLPKESFEINASAYTASADECGNDKGITASGIKVAEKRTIACPPSFPFGAKIAIEGMGIYICEDRGGAIKGNHIDIYVETKKEAFAFGRQHLMAQVVFE